MGSKHDLLPSHLHKGGLVVLHKVSLQTIAIVSGLLAGFCIGHLYQQHNQVRFTAAARVAASALPLFQVGLLNLAVGVLGFTSHCSCRLNQRSLVVPCAALQVVLVEHLYTHGEQCKTAAAAAAAAAC